MDPVNFVVWALVAVVLTFLLFQAKFWGKIFGIEYFDKIYSFQKPMSVNQIRDVFISLRLDMCQKNVCFNINMKRFYSIGYEKLDDLSSWVDMEYGFQVYCYDSDIQYRNAWIINICGPNLHCAVCHGDSDLLFEDDTYSEIRLVGHEIIKFPWNRRKIEKEKQFLEDIASALKNAEFNIEDESIN